MPAGLCFQPCLEKDIVTDFVDWPPSCTKCSACIALHPAPTRSHCIRKSRVVWGGGSPNEGRGLMFAVRSPGLLSRCVQNGTNKAVLIPETAHYSRFPQSPNILHLGFFPGSGTHVSKSPTSHRFYSPNGEK